MTGGYVKESLGGPVWEPPPVVKLTDEAKLTHGSTRVCLLSYRTVLVVTIVFPRRDAEQVGATGRWR